MKIIIAIIIIFINLSFAGEYEKIYDDFLNAKPNTFEVYDISGFTLTDIDIDEVDWDDITPGNQ